ncbi:MAG: serine/threonine protein kinase [Verrucomicrobiales bacterium]|nr:serine/threonine protein kinase [Verrucomicrobiales bacterium]
MKTPMNSPEKCPGCGKTLPSGVLAGLCPACLLAQGAETETGGASAGRERFEPPPLEVVAALFPQLEILGLLGAGGMGAVYQARQPALDRWVALKVLPAGGGGGPAFEERFNREARALARLSHPNIVTVHEFGRAGTLHYFIMEYVDGPNLRQLERSGRLAAREALQIIPQICDALQYAHDQGVVHRDIKPENVLVDRRGRVKIADFGLAKILGRDQDAVRLTVEGQVMGTPHYMAPEQLARPLTVDHRADIYSLGVVFYEMLTGELPLGHFEPPSRKVEVDVRLDEVVLRALENDPVRRFQKASEVRTRIETIAEAPKTPEGPKPAAMTSPSSRRRARNWALAGVLALGVGLVLQRILLSPGSRIDGESGGVTADRQDSAPGVRTATLPGGGALRLLAVGDGGSDAPGTWWRPDGTPMPGVRFELSGNPGPSPAAGTRTRELVFQTTDVPVSENRPVFEGEPALNPLFRGVVTENGGPMKGGWGLRDTWSASVKSGTIRIGIPDGGWRTIRTWLPGDGSRTSSDEVRDPEWNASIERVTDPGSGVTVVARLDAGSAGLSDGTRLCRFLTPGPQAKDWRLRFRLLDRRGEEHVHGIATSTVPDGDTLRHLLWRIEFPEVALARVVRVEIQVQRLDWIEFADIALEPRTGAPQFGPVHEMEVAALLDLDTGKTGEFPTVQPGTAVFDLTQNLSFMQEHGFDAEAGVTGINLLGVRVLKLPAKDWDTLDAAELHRRMQTAKSFPGSVGDEGISPADWVYGYRTREGGVGLLQILRYRDRAPGAILRFKTVTSPKSIP